MPWLTLNTAGDIALVIILMSDCCVFFILITTWTIAAGSGIGHLFQSSVGTERIFTTIPYRINQEVYGIRP